MNDETALMKLYGKYKIGEVYGIGFPQFVTDFGKLRPPRNVNLSRDPKKIPMDLLEARVHNLIHDYSNQR